MEENDNNNPNSIHYKRTPPPEKLYLGNLREKYRQNGDQFLVGYICKDEIDNLPVEHFKKFRDGKTYLRIVINPLIEGVNEHGNTHSCAVDTFKPSENKDIEDH